MTNTIKEAMSKEDDDDNIVVQGDVGESTQVQEEEEQTQKQDWEKEDMEVAEGQQLEVLPKNEEKQDILLTEAISTTPKRRKVAKTKPSVTSQIQLSFGLRKV